MMFMDKSHDGCLSLIEMPGPMYAWYLSNEMVMLFFCKDLSLSNRQGGKGRERVAGTIFGRWRMSHWKLLRDIHCQLL